MTEDTKKKEPKFRQYMVLEVVQSFDIIFANEDKRLRKEHLFEGSHLLITRGFKGNKAYKNFYRYNFCELSLEQLVLNNVDFKKYPIFIASEKTLENHTTIHVAKTMEVGLILNDIIKNKVTDLVSTIHKS